MILQMADEEKKQAKEAEKAQKQAEKEALKAKKERIKASKPKKAKDGNIFKRMGRAIKKFFKDFKGTCKKIVWPDAKTVWKKSGIVLVVVLLVGAGVWLVDFAFQRSVRGVQHLAENYHEGKAEEESESAAAEEASDEFVLPESDTADAK